MPRTGELTYFKRIGLEGQRHALAKPFSDEDSGLYFQRVGALFNLLPPPPAGILPRWRLRLGAGWHTSWPKGVTTLSLRTWLLMQYVWPG